MTDTLETGFVVVVATGLAVLVAGAIASAILLDAVMGALSTVWRAVWGRAAT